MDGWVVVAAISVSFHLSLLQLPGGFTATAAFPAATNIVTAAAFLQRMNVDLQCLIACSTHNNNR